MNDTSGVKRFFEYLPESIKFHKLKNEGLAKFIFTFVLIFQLAGDYIQYRVLNLIPQEEMDKVYFALAGMIPETEAALPNQHTISTLFIILGTALLVKLVSNLFFSVYMYSYISELRGKDTGFKACFKGTFKHMGRLICYNVVFGLMVTLGLMFFIVPAIIVYIIFIFGYCYILDLKLTVSDAMTASSEISKGKKMQIVSVFIGFFLLLKFPIFLLISGSTFGTACLTSFFGTITSLILQRLIVQVYMDLEYKKGIKTK